MTAHPMNTLMIHNLHTFLFPVMASCKLNLFSPWRMRSVLLDKFKVYQLMKLYFCFDKTQAKLTKHSNAAHLDLPRCIKAKDGRRIN